MDKDALLPVTENRTRLLVSLGNAYPYILQGTELRRGMRICPEQNLYLNTYKLNLLHTEIYNLLRINF